MRTFKALAVALAMAAGLSFPGRPAAGGPAQAKAEKDDASLPLVRMDLLEREPSPPAPPGRNIFSPQPVSVGQAVPAAPVNPFSGGPPPGESGEPAAAVPGEPSETGPTAALSFSVDLRFIGYVDSPRTRKIIGLVIFQGQARAVVEGEVISEGVRIGKIGREEIEVVLPDSSTRTFSLEGEE